MAELTKTAECSGNIVILRKQSLIYGDSVQSCPFTRNNRMTTLKFKQCPFYCVLNTTALMYRKSASSRTNHDSCHAQGYNKQDTAYRRDLHASS